MSPAHHRWTGAVAVVTGASSGIGAAVARLLAQQGLRVAACARRIDRLQQLREAGDVLPVACDLRDEAQICSVFDRVDAEWGGADVLVNNAGLGYEQSLASGDTEKWREVLDVNVLALGVATREFLTRLEARGAKRGHVIHVSSLSAHRVPPGAGMYAATKHAVKALTEALRKELRSADSQVRVSSVSPGNVYTEFHARSASDDEPPSWPYRLLDPADVAEAVRWVLFAPEHVEVHDLLLRPTGQST